MYTYAGDAWEPRMRDRDLTEPGVRGLDVLALLVSIYGDQTPLSRSVLYSTLQYSTILYSTLLCSTLLYSTLIYCTVLYCTVLNRLHLLLHYLL